MTITYVVRHASTAYSRVYRVNGDPSVPVCLDEPGRLDCQDFQQATDWLADVRSCVVTRFVRTRQTAEILLAGTDIRPVPAGGLDEIDYGGFEGGPWTDYGTWLAANGRYACPPGSKESLHTAQNRVLAALGDCLALPGPRMVVTHGMTISLLRRLIQCGDLGGLFLPAAEHLSVVRLSDEQLAGVVARGRGRAETPASGVTAPAAVLP